MQVPQNLWQRQFGVENDFPPTAPKHHVAICTTPRCGSHFLGHQMRDRNCFGYPLEYLNPGNLPVWQRRAQMAGAGDTLEFIKSIRTGPNGVFSTKLHHEHLEGFLDHEPDPLKYRFIHLRRRDLLRQAVSFARAQQTGAWISDMPEQADASYDRDLIAEKVEAISQGNARWSAFLSSLGIQPLEIYYEDIVADRDASLERIAAYLGVALETPAPGEAEFRPKPQRHADDPTETWIERFKAETREKIGHRSPVPGYRRTSKSRRLVLESRRSVKGALRRIGLVG